VNNANKVPNVLVVDDEELIIEIYVDILEYENFKLLKACSGNEAIEVIKKHPEPIDAIISDVRMPNGDGLFLVDWINKNFQSYQSCPQKPILFFSSGFSDVTADKIKALGVSGLFAKPFDAEVLIVQLRKSLKLSN